MENNNVIDIPSLQWYPGHMRKAEHLVQENLQILQWQDDLRGSSTNGLHRST